jgi:hypothetical protein
MDILLKKHPFITSYGQPSSSVPKTLSNTIKIAFKQEIVTVSALGSYTNLHPLFALFQTGLMG